MEDQVTLLDYLVGRCYGIYVYSVDQGPIQWEPYLIDEINIDMFPYISTHCNRLLKWLTVPFIHFINARDSMTDIHCGIKERLLQAGIPLPNFVVINSFNHHAELWYGLKMPVKINKDDTGQSPSLFCKQVYNTIKAKLGSNRLSIMSRSMSPWWTNHDVITFHSQGMMLADIKPAGALSNNTGMYLDIDDYLFEKGRVWAYTRVQDEIRGTAAVNRFEIDLMQYLLSLDLSEFVHLDRQVEVAAKVVSSITAFVNQKYRSNRITYSQAQSERGKMKGAALREEWKPKVFELLDQGLTPGKIILQVKVSKRTVENWAKEWRENRSI